MHRTSILFADYTGGYANFVRRGKSEGDCEISSGCENCYVKRIWVRNPDAWPDTTTYYPDKLEQLKRCRPKPGAKPYRRGPGSDPLVFVVDTGDLFHKDVPDEFILRALEIMYWRVDITWQILTKRVDRMVDLVIPWVLGTGFSRVPDHMWFGATTENQEMMDKRVPELIRIPSDNLWLSVEPQLGYVRIPNSEILATRHKRETGHRVHFHAMHEQRAECMTCGIKWHRYGGINWVVVGGESGSHARGAKWRWFKELWDQCSVAGINFFMKQAGSVLAREMGMSGKGENPAGWLEPLPREIPHQWGHVRLI